MVGRHAGRAAVALRPDRRALSALSRVSADLLARTIALRASLLTTTAVAARLGTADVAAHHVAFQVWNLLALVLDAVAIAAQALVGHRLGAGDTEGATDVSRRMLAWGAWTGGVAAIAVVLSRPWLPLVFSDDDGVVRLAAFLLLWVAAVQPVNGVVFVLDGILIGAGDTRFLALAMAAATLAFVPVAAAVASMGLGIGVLWAAFTGFQVARLAALYLRWRDGRWAVPGAG